jgi:hypothetical protein
MSKTGMNMFFSLAGLAAVFFAAALQVTAAENAAVAQSDSEVWNAGVDCYRQGNVTNALRLLRPLMLSKTYGARSAEIVAKLEHERGNREEAVSASQIALRSNPNDARVQRNFTRASDGLLQYREAKRIEAVINAAKDKDPGSMLISSMKATRELMEEAGTYRTNAAERTIAISDKLAKKADSLADVWIVAGQAIAQAVTNEEQASTIMLQIDAAKAKTKKAAKELSDIDEAAYSTLSDVEHDFTRFAKLTAMPPAAIAEDLVCQSNAWMDVAPFNNREWQKDALDYTQAFRANFPAWARAYEQQAQADTNKPPFKAEDQAKISALATELEKLQLECCQKVLPPKQEQALELIRQIQELLPKDQNGGGGGQGQPSAQPENDKNDKNDKDKQEQEQKNDDKEQNNQQQNNEQDKQDEQQDEDKGGQEEQDKEDQQVEAVLKKAQERNDEHEAEKKARMRKTQLPPNERDW